MQPKLTRKFIAINTYNLKEERVQISNLRAHPMKLKEKLYWKQQSEGNNKEQKTKIQRVEKQENNETKFWFFEKENHQN